MLPGPATGGTAAFAVQGVASGSTRSSSINSSQFILRAMRCVTIPARLVSLTVPRRYSSRAALTTSWAQSRELTATQAAASYAVGMLGNSVCGRLVCFQNEFAVFLFGEKAADRLAILAVGDHVTLPEALLKESQSFVWKRAVQCVCSRRSFRTTLYFYERTHTLCRACRPVKASSESMFFFLVIALDAEQSSII